MSGPVADRRRLAADLRRFRSASGRTVEDVARYLECSPAKVSRMETGVVKVGVQDLRALLELYDIDGPAREELLARARESRRRGWWQEFADLVPPGSARFYGLEDAAVTIAQHSASLVPGLLQTRGYAAALIGSVPGIDAPLADQRVELRMRRQRLLDRGVAPRLHVVLDEAVLCRRVGGSAVLAEQLRHLLVVAQRPTVTMQVVEFTAATHPAVGVSFTVFELDGATGTDRVVFREQLDANSFVEHPDQVAIYTTALTAAAGAAASPERSHEIVRKHLARL
ncbi:MAG: helix-turn-helix domain-containing protein [Dehalococcoidia bacterium]